MTDSTRISQRLYLVFVLANTLRGKYLRAPLAALALLCIAAAPQIVVAQTETACGPPITLSANQWRMVGIPCVPSPGSVTPPRPDRRNISGVFGPSLGVADYGVTWIVWKRVYDDDQCVVSSGPADCYVKLSLTSPANLGDAFWVYTTQAREIQFSSSSTLTPGPYFEFPAKLATDGNSRFYMFANPFPAAVRWADLRFATGITYMGDIYPVEVTTEFAVEGSIVSKNVHYWNGNTYYTRDLSLPEASFEPKEAAWLEMLTPLPAVTPDVLVKVPMP